MAFCNFFDSLSEQEDSSDAKDFNVCVLVVEARHLPFSNMETLAGIEVGHLMRFTRPAGASNRPFFNEYFVFEFHTTPNEMKDLTLTLTVYYLTRKMHKRRRLGSARLDIGGVWSQPDHEIDSKWVILTDPNDPAGKICGYLKFSIYITGGQNPTPRLMSPKITSQDPQEEMKQNLLIPEKLGQGKTQAKYSVKVHLAQDLRKWRFAHLPHKLSKYNYDKKKSFLSYVKVCFAGLTAETSRKRNTRSPVWNEELVFYETFPPMYNRLRIELHVGKLFSAKHLDLSRISNPGIKGFLPTYGPSYLHFYKQNFHFVGSLLLSISTQTFGAFFEDEKLQYVKKRTIEPLPKNYFNREEFALCGVVHEVSMLDGKHTSNKDVWMTLSFGGSDPTNNNDNGFVLKTPNYKSAVMNQDGSYQYLPLSKSKPCFFLKSTLPDFRHRGYNSNKLAAIARHFRNNLRIVYSMKDKGDVNMANEFLNQALQNLKEQCHSTSQSVKPGTTELDKERTQTVSRILDRISSDVSNISAKISLKVKFDKALDLLETIFEAIEDPQESYPNVVVYLWNSERMISYTTIKTNDILYSEDESEKGYKCGVVHSSMLKTIHRTYYDFGGKMEIFLWFGPYSAVGYCLQSLPPGHADITNLTKFPTEIEYSSHLELIFRSHISKAYLEPYGTPHGYFNSFVKVLFANRSGRTITVANSICPVWKETVTLEVEIEYGEYSFMKANPPIIICEVWNEGEAGNRIIGRCIARPNIFLKSDSLENYPPQLHWHKIVSKEKTFGEILAMFELIEPIRKKSASESEADEGSSNRKLEAILEAPDYAYPKTRTYRLEVLFWGMRKMKSIKYEVKTPRIIIACSQALLASEVLKKGLNFCDKPKFAEIEADDIKSYAPPLIIRAYEYKSFGVTSFVGSHVVKNIQQFRTELVSASLWEQLASKNAELLVNIPKIIKANTKDKVADSALAQQNENDDRFEETDQVQNDNENVNSKDSDTTPLIDRKLSSDLAGHSGVPKEKVSRKSITLISKNKYESELNNPGAEGGSSDWWSKYYYSLENSGTAAIPTQSKFLQSHSAILKKLVTPKLPTIEFYSGELEKQVDFEGFTDTLKTFDIMRTFYKQSIKKKCTAQLKVAVCIYPWPAPNTKTQTRGNPIDGVFKEIAKKAKSTIKIAVRVYVVKGHNVYSYGKKKPASPFIVVSVNSKTISDSKNYVVQDCNPVFGRCYELNATFPNDSVLTVRLMEFDRFGAHDIIGETVIDIENRFFSRHRGSCGIASEYLISGSNAWRDVQKPSEILKELCTQYSLDEPKYVTNNLIVGTIKVNCQKNVEDVKEYLALKALKKWHTVPGIGVHLVPEHIEVRTLYHPEQPDIERGKIEMWVDLLPLDDKPLPPPIDIKPRKPDELVLRVIVWKTSKIELVDESLLVGKKHGDIIIRGWLLGKDVQQTDVHFVCTTGTALFNWRFIFPFSYMPAEKFMVLNMKAQKQNVEIKKPPILHIEAWDYDRFSQNEYIGALELDLENIPKSTYKFMWVYTNLVKRRSGNINLFKMRNLRGWWPLTGQNKSGKEKCVGLIDLELELLTKQEAEFSPAGHGRSEPIALPFPERPIVKKSFLLVPFRALNRFLFRRNKKAILRCVFIVSSVLFIGIFLYSFPQYTVKLIMGA